MVGHVRKGRTFRSPIAATGVLQIGDWVRDDLPDLLWPVLLLSERGTHGAQLFVRWQAAVQQDLGDEAEPQFVADCLDGRLTGLDTLAARIPVAKDVVKKRADEHGLLPDPVARALASYPVRPAEWLTGPDETALDQSGIDLLARAVIGVITDGHREAVIKCLSIWSAVQAGRFSSDPTMIQLLRSYPVDLDTRSQADSVVRASWGARKGMLIHHDAGHFDESIQWARAFWDANSVTTHCTRRRDLEAVGDASEEVSDFPQHDAAPHGETSTGSSPDDGAHLRQLAMDLVSSYVEALETSPARLYDHEPQEVHSGLVVRVGRDVITALGSPDLWCMEHGAHIVRALVEARIYLQWMAEQDQSIYRTFQEYGAGKAKLYARILDETPEEARRPDFVEGVRELERLSHNDKVLDHRVVDTRDSFAEGKSIRSMADECGLIDLYRQAYSMASGVAHSEWWSIETHAMERCLNVLHGGHLIPSLSLSSGANVELASSWIDQLHALIRTSLTILGTDSDAVETAFAWLDGTEDPDQ
jgi:hypothetical protein